MRALMVGLALTGVACSNGTDRAAADANAAGFVPPSVTSRADYGTLQDRRFRRLDRDGDDVLTRDELSRANPRLLALDRNKDGRITMTEFSEGQLKRFDAMDLNRDGALTSDERVEAQQRAD